MMNSTIKNNTSWGRDLNAKKRDENLNRVVQKTPTEKMSFERKYEVYQRLSHTDKRMTNVKALRPEHL